MLSLPVGEEGGERGSERNRPFDVLTAFLTLPGRVKMQKMPTCLVLSAYVLLFPSFLVQQPRVPTPLYTHTLLYPCMLK